MIGIDKTEVIVLPTTKFNFTEEKEKEIIKVCFSLNFNITLYKSL